MSASICEARSKPAVTGKPDSYFICTNDEGHQCPEHTACNGHGHVLARWASETSPIETWVPFAGFHAAGCDPVSDFGWLRTFGLRRFLRSCLVCGQKWPRRHRHGWCRP